MTDDLTAGVSVTRIEEEIRRFWRLHEVPEQSLVARSTGQAHSILQEPLSVAGQSRMDQVRLLSTADLLARYRTMRGQAVQVQTSWLCHGLPIEVAVEQAFARQDADGTLNQPPAGSDRSALAQFNAVCWDFTTERLDQQERLAQWLGVWRDPEDTCISCTPQAIGVVWGALHRLWEAARLGVSEVVVPVCPRCATPLSASESNRLAVQVDARSLWVRLPWVGETGTYLLAWSPAPWKLIGMVALAAHPGAEYVLLELPSEDDAPAERILVAEDALSRVPIEGYRVLRRLRGRALRDVQYHPPFTFLPADQGSGRLLLSQEVSPEAGSGLQIVIPSFDASSFQLARTHNLPVPRLLDDGGNLGGTVGRWRGLSPLDAEPQLIEDLRARGLVFRDTSEVQDRSLCPYCETPLLPLAREVWQVRTPDLAWTIGRDRAWGVPIPVWTCEACAEQVCVAGLDDLAHRAGLDVQEIDPHRPALDAVTLPCTKCRGTMWRVDPVVDASFEAAVLSLATCPSSSPGTRADGTVHVAQAPEQSLVALDAQASTWPTDLVRTAALLDAPLAVAQLVQLPALASDVPGEVGPYAGRSASADALRWATYMRTTPEQAEQEFLQPLWRLAADLQVADGRPGKGERTETRSEFLGNWLRARLCQAVGSVGEALDAGDTFQAAGQLAGLVRDLSVHFTPGQHASGGTLLTVLTQLLAPFLPHLAEAIHRRLFKSTEESLHLASWPDPDPEWADPDLLAQMAQLQRLAALGSAARSRAGLEPGLPLRRAIISLEEGGSSIEGSAPAQDLLAEMMGVGQVQLVQGPVEHLRWRVELDREQGIERGALSAGIHTVLAELSREKAAEVAAQLRAGFSVGLEIGDQAITLLPDEVSISVQGEPGWIAAEGSGGVVALELN